ncbi:hypothetical protein NE237_031586 [Protea cynaroides]|uniref:CCHC-type domain-containing protein n=1 Tax=Protea cynaroides TaxID=273540 RepID=A0A9Q0L1S3_9MAGN|nr:hypothetical protein NE237_031586 [Protea cynaroides]
MAEESSNSPNQSNNPNDLVNLVLQRLAKIDAKLDNMDGRMSNLEELDHPRPARVEAPRREALNANLMPRRILRAPQRVPREEYHNPPYEDYDEPIRYQTQKVRMNLKEFHGRQDPEAFQDWLNVLDDYFDWFNLPEPRKLQLARSKLVGSARDWWRNYEYSLMRSRREPTTWEEMKEQLKEKYLSRSFQRRLHDQLNNLRQGNMSMEDYVYQFDQLCARSGSRDNDDQIISRFRLGLRPEIREKMGVVDIVSFNDCVDKAFQAEDLLKSTPKPTSSSYELKHPTPNSKAIGTTSHATPTTDKSKTPMVAAMDVQCYHCNAYGHFARDCPQKLKVNSLVAAIEANPDTQVCEPQNDDTSVPNTDVMDDSEDSYGIHIITSMVLIASKVDVDNFDAFAKAPGIDKGDHSFDEDHGVMETIAEDEELNTIVPMNTTILLDFPQDVEHIDFVIPSKYLEESGPKVMDFLPILQTQPEFQNQKTLPTEPTEIILHHYRTRGRVHFKWGGVDAVQEGPRPKLKSIMGQPKEPVLVHWTNPKTNDTVHVNSVHGTVHVNSTNNRNFPSFVISFLNYS